jgi:NACalpha-BTF3-like transcription factor
VADVKALSEEKDVRLAADQSLVEEKGAQRAFEEANAALTQDI